MDGARPVLTHSRHPVLADVDDEFSFPDQKRRIKEILHTLRKAMRIDDPFVKVDARIVGAYYLIFLVC